MTNHLINSAKLYLLILAAIGFLVACGPADESVQRQIGNLPGGNAQDEGTAKPTPYPTVCVVIEEPVGTFNDECFVDKPAPTPVYDKIIYPRLSEAVKDYMDAYEDPMRDAERPNPNSRVGILIETHPGQMDTVVTWLKDKDAVNLEAESNWISVRLHVKYVPELNNHDGVRKILTGDPSYPPVELDLKAYR